MYSSLTLPKYDVFFPIPTPKAEWASRKLIFTDYCGFHNCEICSDEEHHHARGRIETVLDWEGQEIKGWRLEPNVSWKGQELTVIGLGHHLIRCGQIVYMAPALLLHYIQCHQYKPPDEFVNAVIDGRFLTQEDLVFRPTVQFV